MADQGAEHKSEIESKRLWEIDHPYYGAEAGGNYALHFDTFAELKANVDGCDEDMNFVYRWDWFDPNASHNDDLYLEGEARGKQRLSVFVVLQRKSAFLNWTCDVTHADEPAVLEWLHSDRILGSLRRTWEPVLDLAPDAPMELAHLRADLDYWRGRAQAAEAMVTRLEQRITTADEGGDDRG